MSSLNDDPGHDDDVTILLRPDEEKKRADSIPWVEIASGLRHLEQLTLSRILLFLLFAFASMGPYLMVFANLVELPFYLNLPEGVNIQNYFTVFGQLATLLVLLCEYSRIWIPINSKSWGFISIIAGIIVALLEMFFWDRVTVVAGRPHSVALIVLQSFASWASGISTLSVWALAGDYGPTMVAAVNTGTGLASVISSILSSIQGVGTQARFSPSILFVIVGSTGVFSLLCWIMIVLWNPEKSKAEIQKDSIKDEISYGKVFPFIREDCAHIFFSSFVSGIIVGSLAYRLTGWNSPVDFLHWSTISLLVCVAALPILASCIRIYAIKTMNVLQTIFWVPLFLTLFVDKAKLPSWVAWLNFWVSLLHAVLSSYLGVIILQHTTLVVPPIMKMKALRLVGVSSRIGLSIGTLVILAFVLGNVIQK